MKNIILSIVTVVMIITAISCNQLSGKNSEQPANDTPTVPELPAASQLKKNDTVAAVSGDPLNSKDVKPTVQEETKGLLIAPIVSDYLTLKNALVADNGKSAADAGKKLLATLKAVDMKRIPADKHKEYMDIADDAMENAEHIGDNAGKIEHQREHLASLSKDINDLIAMFGAPQKLYQDKCPMFNDGRGAIWISETKEIKNPYYGSKMITCGSVKKEYKDEKKD
ncbi:DUF3347 domain-containing protein [Niabella hirudinis]|uniref:DUF3347 domain-containing protein n=1 Tax=Niabella hirudinis TaxID=1285929 RepID=UPI003EBF75F8